MLDSMLYLFGCLISIFYKFLLKYIIREPYPQFSGGTNSLLKGLNTFYLRL